MNKASLHVTQPGNTTGLGDCLNVTANAGRPLPIIYAVNANIKSDIQRYSPSTQLVYRRQSETFNRLPGDFFVGDPVHSATTWMTTVRDKADQNRTLVQNWALNPADYYDPLNEPVVQLPLNPTDADTQEAIRKAQWLNTWMITALNIAHANGFKLAMFSFPTGTLPLSMWTYLFPALRLGKQDGAILSLHEYSVEGTMQSPQPGNVLRYRDVWNLLPEDCRVPIIVSECGAGNGYDTSLRGQAWINDLMWYNEQACQDDYLLGFCAFQVGGSESNMVSTLPAYRGAISSFRCPAVQESSNGTTIPSSSQIVDSALHVWKFGTPVPMGYVILCDGVQFAGGQGSLLLYWDKKVYTQNANHEWYVADAGWTRVSGDPRSTESSDGTLVPPSPSISDSDHAVWTLGNASAHGYLLLKNGIQFAGGQGILLLYSEKKVYTQNDLGEWYVAGDSWTRVAGDPRAPVEGIDVSHYQGNITWSQAKKKKKFSFIKATEGSDIPDSTFGANWSNAKYYGVPRGVYHFYRFADSPTDQAAFFIGALNKDYGELPLVVDLEDEATPANFNDLKVFVDLVQNTTRRRVILYSGAWWFNKHHYVIPNWMKSHDWWLASYTEAPLLPEGVSRWTFWQYSSSGSCPGISRLVDLDRFNGNTTDFQNYLKTVTYTSPVPPQTTMKSGVGVGNQYPFTAQELDAIQLGKCETALLMTMPDYAQMRQQVQMLRAKVLGIDIVGRLFFPEDSVPYTPQQALAYCRNGLQGMYDEGVRQFQIGNEANITPGGMGWNWQNGTQFATWLDSMLALLQSQFPGCQWGYPALSPQPNTVQFFTDSKIVADKCDWVGVHSYFWTWSGGTYNAIDESGGFSWLAIARLTNKPLYLTEYSANTATLSYSDKGTMYKNYISLLKQDGRISKAHCFALSWGYQDVNKEAWCVGDARNQITDIPRYISA